MKIFRNYSELLIEGNGTGESSSDTTGKIKPQVSERNGVAFLGRLDLKPWKPGKVEEGLGSGALAGRLNNASLLCLVNHFCPRRIFVGKQRPAEFSLVVRCFCFHNAIPAKRIKKFWQGGDSQGCACAVGALTQLGQGLTM